jgi:hypothetical protein
MVPAVLFAVAVTVPVQDPLPPVKVTPTPLNVAEGFFSLGSSVSVIVTGLPIQTGLGLADIEAANVDVLAQIKTISMSPTVAITELNMFDLYFICFIFLFFLFLF